jgi:nucleotide-binding universal stress UspA family protein
MKILLAVDGSECSLTGVRYLIKHRAMFGDDSALTLLYVDPPFVEHAQTVLGTLGVQQAHDHNARTAFHKATRLLKRARIPHETIMRVGDPGPRIARYAAEGGYDIVVLGSHGHGALAGLMLGSVVTKVLAICAVPVLVTR